MQLTYEFSIRNYLTKSPSNDGNGRSLMVYAVFGHMKLFLRICDHERYRMYKMSLHLQDIAHAFFEHEYCDTNINAHEITEFEINP